MERSCPVRERAKIELLKIESVADLPRALATIVEAAANGGLALSEATALCGMLSQMRSAFELVDISARLEAVERALPAGPGASGTGLSIGSAVWTLKYRIASAEARLRLLSPGLRVISIRGGLAPDASGDFTTFNGVQIEREADETPDGFRVRAHEEARAAGAKVLAYGGLPRRPMA
jgi:hypothetical protein